MSQPIKKFLKFILWAVGGVAALVVLLLVAAAIIIPIKFPPEKMKALATQKLSETLHHSVSVGEVKFSVLSGFEVKNLKIANRPGWDPTPMVVAKDISISYDLFPLLWGQISLGEVKLNQPDILIERRGMDSFNFSDMSGDAPAAAAPAPAPAAKPATAKSKAKPKAKPKKKAKKHAALIVPTEKVAFHSIFADSAWAAPVPAEDQTSKTVKLLTVGNVRIIHGKLTYLDRTVSPEQRYLLSDLNLHVMNISMVGGKTHFTLSTPVEANKQKYQASLKGSLRYLMGSSLIKDLDLEGMVNDAHGFKVTGDVGFGDGFAPKLDGDASLDGLKFFDLIPRGLAQMPQGLTLKGPAKVDFHLEGNSKSGLTLSGTADGSDLAIQYKDYYVKTNKTPCKVDFKSMNRLQQGTYDVSAFKVHYQDWDVNGEFHYRANGAYSGEVHSKSIPFKGLPGMFPKLKDTTVGGSGVVDIQFSQPLGKAESLRMDGVVNLKGVEVTLPSKQSYVQDVTGPMYLNGNLIKLPKAAFKTCGGTGMAGVTWNYISDVYSYGLNLKGVDAEKLVNMSIDAYVAKKDYSSFKDTLAGTLDLSYAGSGKGFSGDAMLASQVGSGTYVLTNAVFKKLTAIKGITELFKDKSGQITFAKIDGTLGMKAKVFSYTANTTDKVGTMKIVGGVNSEGVYTPDMRIRCDIKKEYLDSDQVKNLLKEKVGDKVPADKIMEYIADDQGNVPVDFRFTGPASKVPGLDCIDLSRAGDNALKRFLKETGEKAGQAVQQGAKDLIKGLFGK